MSWNEQTKNTSGFSEPTKNVGASGGFLLKEDGGYLLQETGDKILLEDGFKNYKSGSSWSNVNKH